MPDQSSIPFGQFIKELRESKKLTLSEVAKFIGISHSHLSRIENGERNPPKARTLQKLSKLLNVPFNVLMKQAGYEGEYIEYDPLTLNRFVHNLLILKRTTKRSFDELGEYIGQSTATILNYRDDGLPPLSTLERIAEFFEIELDDLLYKNLRDSSDDESDPLQESLIVTGPIKANGEALIDSEGFSFAFVDPSLLDGKKGFAFRVQDDSMSGDRILKGDVVVAVTQSSVEPNEIAVVSLGEDFATLKRVKQQDNLCILIPSNPSMQPEIVPCEQVHILGKLVEVKFNPNQN